MEEIIETERLILRRPKASNASDLFLIFNNNEVNEFVPFFYCNSISDTERWIEFNVLLHDRYCFLIIEKATNEIIGIIYSLVHLSDSITSVLYAIRDTFRCNGFMSEALKSFLLFLYEKNTNNLIEFCIFNENKPSLAIMKHLKINLTVKLQTFSVFNLSLKEKPLF